MNDIAILKHNIALYFMTLAYILSKCWTIYRYY